MMENGRGLIKALENWAKRVTSDYKDVDVHDLSTSFRDGLAFCAIIHHYRSDLINFDSLSKENIYENNSLAFSVAEKQLGVPALLDAEDMVKYSKPDRLSIITYLSQLRNCFENQNKVSKKPDLKRIQSNSAGPPAKVPVVPVSDKRHEVCQVCQHRVFILERLIVDGKLYHTTCFRCHKCNALLNPGAYVEADAPGLYECTVCVTDEVPESKDLSLDIPKKLPIDTPSPQVAHCPDFRSKESITFAKSNLWQEDRKADLDFNLPNSTVTESKNRSESSISVKDKINVFENRPKSPIVSRPVPKPRQSLLLSPRLEADCGPNSPIICPAGSTRSEDGSVSQKNTKESEENDLPITNFEHPSPLRENIFRAKGGGESPRMPRDIFKSSLSPLKLNLPSSVRKDSDKTSPIYSMTLPYSRSISLLKQPDKMFSSDAKLQSDSKVIRRSSLESSYEPNKEDRTSTEAVSFSRTYSSQEIRGDSKAVPNTYTPVYKSSYNSSNKTNDVLAPKLILRPLFINPKHSYEIENAEKKSFKSTESVTLERDFSVDSKNSEIAEKFQAQNQSTESFTPGKDFHVDPEKLVKIQDESKELERDDSITSPPVVGALEKSETKSLLAEEYPDDLNPFGEDDVGEEEYPDDLNPFGDNEDEVGNNPSAVNDYDESKNPFASDDDEDSSKISENKTPHNSICSNVSSPSGSLKGTLKKRRAPKPPPPRVGDIFPSFKDSAADSGVDSSFSSPSLSRKNFYTSSPKVRKSKPAPPPPPQDPAANSKRGKESDNMKLRMQQEMSVPKKKKRPAPSVPIPVRRDMKKIPLKEIMREMKEIEEKQREYEKQGREIELLIRDRDKDEEPSVEEEEYIMQLFELVNQKNALFRRQAELMYIKRSQRLEELQHQVEKEIRQLMEKPESEKTGEDRQKEEELTMELIDIVDQRNSIIDSIEMDRRRELEEDHSVQEQLEIKNGDLQITAEIKQKSGKAKKKAKKEKKKKKEEESGKGTLKKKKNLFSK